MPRMSFENYIAAVRLEIDELTEGVIDLDDLPDAYDLGEAYEDELTPRAAAREVLEEAGFFDFSF